MTPTGLTLIEPGEGGCTISTDGADVLENPSFATSMLAT
jgi:hypothetical protein